MHQLQLQLQYRPTEDIIMRAKVQANVASKEGPGPSPEGHRMYLGTPACPAPSSSLPTVLQECQ